MRTTCKAFEQFDWAEKKLASDQRAAMRYDAFQREERSRLIAAGFSQNDARELLPLY